jgi:L-threonylcarbamoyladenylate synthase
MKEMPETVRLRAENAGDVKRAAEMLREGKLVAFATETVYGLGANALSAEAVARIFEAKQRPSWDPLIVHVAEVDEIGRAAIVEGELRERVERLARAFWPGPLTLLLPKAEAIPASVTAGRPLVGVRVPAHPVARELLREAGVPVAAPSANRFGRTSPTTAEHVIADLGGRIDAVLDAGPTQVGVESTVVDATQTPMVLYRPGAVTAQQLREASGVEVKIFEPVKEERAPESLPSPGVGIRHYAPAAKMVLVEGTDAAVRRAVESLDGAEKVGVLLPVGWHAPAGAMVQPWAVWDQPDRLAATLFAGLRALDAKGVDTIVVPLPPPGDLYDAIRDRLIKAARE